MPSRAERDRLYQWSLDDPNGFWAHMAQDYYWKTRWADDARHHRANFDPTKGPVGAVWFEGATTNVCYNALDRWVAAGRGDAAAFIWEGEWERRRV